MSTTVQAPIAAANLRHVDLVSGQVIQVQGDDEVRWFTESRDRYLSEAKFHDATDMRDLDRLLVLELMVYRWTVHLAAGVDYEGNIVDEDGLQKNIRAYSDQITKLKHAMGLSKAARDAEQSEGNVAAYIDNLKRRAKAFGVHREHQLTKAIALCKELFTVVETFDRADPEERTKLGFESEHEILDWVRQTMKPEFDAVDDYFRSHDQRYWVRDL